MELKFPGVHAVLNSSETMGGPVMNGVVFTTSKFRDANPKTVLAFVAALDEAITFIAEHKPEAAKLYIDATREPYTMEELTGILEKPENLFSSTPLNSLKLVDFMYKVGIIKEKPQGWKDLFFPEMHERAGS